MESGRTTCFHCHGTNRDTEQARSCSVEASPRLSRDLYADLLISFGPEGMNALMPWSIERDASALHVRITPPMLGEWENLLDAVRANLEPVPYAIYLPSRVEGSSQLDSEMLTEL